MGTVKVLNGGHSSEKRSSFEGNSRLAVPSTVSNVRIALRRRQQQFILLKFGSFVIKIIKNGVRNYITHDKHQAFRGVLLENLDVYHE